MFRKTSPHHAHGHDSLPAHYAESPDGRGVQTTQQQQRKSALLEPVEDVYKVMIISCVFGLSMRTKKHASPHHHRALRDNHSNCTALKMGSPRIHVVINVLVHTQAHTPSALYFYINVSACQNLYILSRPIQIDADIYTYVVHDA